MSERATKRVSFSWIPADGGKKTVSMPLCSEHYKTYLQWRPFLTQIHREADVDERYCGACTSAANRRAPWLQPAPM